MTQEGTDPADELDETLSASPSPSDNSATRERIGPYRLLKRIGQGGMGEVWLADQQEPVRRRVALKIIKAGMDTRQVVARFEAERQALAMMDHPSIARIYEAGSTPAGRPYFAMELVPGVPVTEHCDRHKLSIRERLELFLQICEGVQHAHQKAIIHRDLKPSNVLVSLTESGATPKIIDFGLAKATAQSLTDRTMFTQIGTTIGTPSYMSPEQAELTGQDIDTRTDVYSLGVMLYELLVGARPFEATGQIVDREELLRRIREDEPQRPSSRLTAADDNSTSVATQRQAQLQGLRTEIAGDLDWITIKALEKDRARRYGSPSELAADIRRFLADEPVSARPPSTTYRARKFVRRHRAGVALSAVSLLVLLGFALTMASQASRIAHERDRANREAAASERAATFLANMLSDVDQSRMGEALGRTLEARVAMAANPTNPNSVESSARRERLRSALRGVNLTDAALHLLDEQVLAQASQRIEATLGDDPRLAGRLHATLSEAYVQLGMYERAVEEAGRALAILEPVEGEAGSTVHATKISLAQSYARLARYGDALEVLRPMLATYQRENADERRLQAVLNNLGDTLRYAGDYAAAGPMLEEALDLSRRVYGDRDIETLITMNNLALVYSAQGRRSEAADLLAEAHRIASEDYGKNSEEAAALGGNLGGELAASGRFEEAFRVLEETVEQERRLYGDDHFDTLLTRLIWGRAYLLADQPGPALEILEPLLARMQRVLGTSHESTLAAGVEVAYAKLAHGELGEAADLLQRLISDCRNTTCAGGSTLADLLIEQAIVSNALGRHDEAQVQAREARELLREGSGEAVWRVAEAKIVLGESLLGARELDTAEALLSEGYSALLETPGEDADRLAADAAERISARYEEMGLAERAADWRQRASSLR